MVELFSYSQSMSFTHYSLTGESTVADEILPYSSVVGLSLTKTCSWIKNGFKYEITKLRRHLMIFLNR